MEYLVEIFPAQSGLAPENLTTLAHFSVSSAISLPKSAGEPGSAGAAKVGKPRLHLGIGEGRIDLLVKPLHDLGRRALWSADAKKRARLVAWHKIGDGRNVRQSF